MGPHVPGSAVPLSPSSLLCELCFLVALPPGWSLPMLRPHGEVCGCGVAMEIRHPMSRHGPGKVSADQPVCMSYLPFSPHGTLGAVGTQTAICVATLQSLTSLPRRALCPRAGPTQSVGLAQVTSSAGFWKVECPGRRGRGLLEHGVSLVA